MEVSLLLYPFKALYFSPLDYSELVMILADNGTKYLNQDPKLAYDVWNHMRKKADENGEA